MRVLIIDENTTERALLTRILELGKHAVEQASAKGAPDVLAKAEVDVVLLAWPKTGGAAIVQHVRARESGSHVHVLVLLDRQPPSEIEAVLTAGADDFTHRPIVHEEIVARVLAPQRIRRWATPQLASLDFSQGNDPMLLRACKSAGTLVAQDLGTLVGQPLSVTEGWSAPLTGRLKGATIPLSLASDETEILVSVAADDAALRSIVLAVIGEEGAGEEGARDMLREMANGGAGAVKRDALAENVTLTMGLPVDQTIAAATGRDPDSMRRWTATSQDGSVRFGILLEVKKRRNEQVPAARLREGMVLARDLKNEQGALLVKAGTRLTATTAERLSSLIGSRVLVEVARAA